MKNVTERVYSFLAIAEKGSVRDVQEKLRYIGVDYDIELKSTSATDKEKTYEFPDRNIIAIGAERLRIAETLFLLSF